MYVCMHVHTHTHTHTRCIYMYKVPGPAPSSCQIERGRALKHSTGMGNGLACMCMQYTRLSSLINVFSLHSSGRNRRVINRINRNKSHRIASSGTGNGLACTCVRACTPHTHSTNHFFWGGGLQVYGRCNVAVTQVVK